MMELTDILAIVRAEETRELVHCAGMTVALAMLTIPAAVYLYRKLYRKFGIAFCLIFAGFLFSMATKPPVTWDSYLKDNGTHYTNNNTTVRFKWAKKVSTVPNTTPLYIDRKANGGSTWETVATSTVGALTYDVAIASTSYTWMVYCDYVPPTPVHTNGVWIGNVIERARGAGNTNKFLIIQGQMLQNGKVIAP